MRPLYVFLFPALIAADGLRAEPEPLLFPKPHKIDGKREFVATLVKLPAPEAFSLIWGDPHELNAAIERHLAEGTAKGLARLRSHALPGKEFSVSKGNKVPFSNLYTTDKPFGQPPAIIVDSVSEIFVGTKCETSDGRLSFEHDLRPPRRWVWRNGEFWGDEPFALRQRSVFSLKTIAPPIGTPTFLGAAEFTPGAAPNKRLETCLLFARRTPSAIEKPADADLDQFLRIDLVTFATSDRGIIAKTLLRNGADDDAKVFTALRAGKSEIYALHSILAQTGKTVKLECNLLHRHPQGLEPRGGTDYEALRYVPESFRAVPESIGLRKFGTQIKLDARVDEDICTLFCEFESTLEPPLQEKIKTNPAVKTARDPAAVGAVRDYRLEFGSSRKLRLGESRLLFAHRPQQFRSSPDRAGIWQLTFVRVTRLFQPKK